MNLVIVLSQVIPAYEECCVIAKHERVIMLQRTQAVLWKIGRIKYSQNFVCQFDKERLKRIYTLFVRKTTIFLYFLLCSMFIVFINNIIKKKETIL